MSALGVVEHLRSLASDPKNRGTIVKDQSCLAGLVLFLDNSDERVVIKALEALQFLSEHPPNRSYMREEIGMKISLKTIMNKEGPNKRAKQLARDVYNSITPSAVNNAPRNRNSAPSHSFFLGVGNKKAKYIILHIKGLTNQITRKLCEQELLLLKGVISFTFDLKKSRCTIRCRVDLTPAVLCNAINKTKVLTAQQVVKNECGEEVMMSFGTNPACASQGNSSSLPDYLPEDDDPPLISDKAVAKRGDKENESGWFNSVTSFFSNNLYW